MNKHSPERKKFHEILQTFKSLLKRGCKVYDVGKSDIHDYEPFWEGFDYQTIDCNETKSPDHVLNIENAIRCIKMQPAAGVIAHGVYEQCDDPYRLLGGIKYLTKKNGLILFGLIGPGYPIFGFDRYRITPQGVDIYLRGLKVIQKQIVERGGVPSYTFVIAEKTHE